MITTIIAVDLGAVFGLIEVKPLGRNSNNSFQPLLANPGKDRITGKLIQKSIPTKNKISRVSGHDTDRFTGKLIHQWSSS